MVGGFFERLTGLVKICLRKVLGQAKLTFDELQTVLVEVEATLNSSPLTYECEEVSAEVLTPSHSIYGRLVSLPDENCVTCEDSTKSSSIARFKYLSTTLHFWNRWRREYLTNLRRLAFVKRTVSLRAGDIVIAFERGKKRGDWKTSIVTETIPGNDGVLRGCRVSVLTSGKRNIISRPVQHLYPMEVGTLENVRDDSDRARKRDVERVRRSAANDSRSKTRAMLDS